MDASRSLRSDLDAIARITAVPGILEAAARSTGMRFVAVAKVDETRWTACAVRDELGFGLLPGGELQLETTICNEIRQHHRPVVFSQASAHPVFSQHHTPRQYGLESYISVPIFRIDGSFFGTLCAIDSVPADLDDPNIVRTFELFAELIGRQLEIEARLEQSEQALSRADNTALLREQFTVLLGHEIRDPLQAIVTGLYLLGQSPGLPEEDRGYIAEMVASCSRISHITRDVVDFACGRLGAGIPLSLTRSEDLSLHLGQALARHAQAQPAHPIQADIRIDGAVSCDPKRVVQVLDHLVDNAIASGDRQRPIEVSVRDDDGVFRLSVRSFAVQPALVMPSMPFEPYAQDHLAHERARIGLGLFVSSQIAKAHAGDLHVESSPQAGTTFSLSFPIAALA